MSERRLGNNFSEFLQEMQILSDYSWFQMSTLLNVSEEAYSDLVWGARNPNRADEARIKKCFKLSTTELVQLRNGQPDSQPSALTSLERVVDVTILRLACGPPIAESEGELIQSAIIAAQSAET